MMSWWLCLILIIGFQFGCSSLRNPADPPFAHLPAGGHFRLLSPRQLGPEQTVSQLLEGEFRGEAVSMRVNWELTASRLAIVGSSITGQPLLTILLTDNGIESEVRFPSLSQFRAEYLLMDLQLVIAPLPALREVLEPAGYELLAGNAPTPYRQLRKNGVLLLDIRYAGTEEWSPLEVHHYLWSYHYRVSTFFHQPGLDIAPTATITP
jgi:phospho-N-acetylmuramoyl-pentapeptide-transferase